MKWINASERRPPDGIEGQRLLVYYYEKFELLIFIKNEWRWLEPGITKMSKYSIMDDSWEKIKWLDGMNELTDLLENEKTFLKIR